MKNVVYGLVLVILFSACKKENKLELNKENPTSLFEKTSADTINLVQKGEDLFRGKANCATCHQVNEKIIGPSIVEIATIYKNKGGDIVSFLKEKSQPIVDPSQYSLMKSNLIITKKMSDDDLKALSEYMMSTITEK